MVLVIWVCILVLILMVMLLMTYFPARPQMWRQPMDRPRKELEGQMPLWVEEALDEMPFKDDEKP